MTEPLQPIAVPRAQEKQEPNSTEAILAERGSKYGSFAGHARVTQTLKRVFLEHMQHHNPEGFKKFMANPTAFEGMEMIMHKLGRAANGEPLYKDTWDDIAGYAKLVADECEF
jgi:hypothetical protein